LFGLVWGGKQADGGLQALVPFFLLHGLYSSPCSENICFQVQSALDSCPVNCIHYVEKDDVPILEYLMKGWERPGVGVFGGRWERPPNVFSAAKDFKKKLERQKERARSGERSSSSFPHAF
jgi:hypothetical protein